MANNTYSLVITYNAAGQFAQNVLHYQFEDVGFSDTATAALALINAYDAAATAKLQLVLSIHVNILSYKSRCISAPGGFESVKLLAAGIIGSRAGNMQNSAMGPIINQYPFGASRRIAKMFLPGISDNDCADGVINNAFSAVLVTNAPLVIPILNLVGGGAPTANPVVRSRSGTGASLPIQYIVPSETVGLLYRRQRPA